MAEKSRSFALDWKAVSVLTGTICHILLVYYVWRMFAAPDWTWWHIGLGLVVAYFMVDFITLMLHWTLDNYFYPDTPIIGQTVYFFREHHVEWDVMFERNWFEGNFENAMVSLVFMVFWLPFEFDSAGVYAWIWMSALGGAYITQIHKWAHAERVWLPVKLLQKLKLIVDKEFHDVHHNDTRTNYGLYAGWFDRLFDKTKFFEALEIGIYLTTGEAAVESRLNLADPDEEKLPLAGRWERVYWRVWYDFLSWYSEKAGAAFHCMNWGYAEDGLDLSEAGGERFPLQLYHVLAEDIPLEDKAIVDVSCGRGGGLTYLHDAFEPAAAIGMDFTPGNVAIAERAFSEERDTLGFEVGNAENTGLNDDSVGAVISVEASHCYGSRERFVEEAWRVLEPGGHLLWTDFAPTDDLPQFRRWVEQQGFEWVVDRDITDNVLEAMALDADRRLALIDEHSHPLLRPIMRNFAAADEDCDTQQRFQNGSYRYFMFKLRKPA